MAFQLSPGVLVVEKDLTGIVPAVATSIGGYVGAFQWGPVEQITTISNESVLTRTFARPNNTVAASWFSAANFLAYGNNLKVVRAVGTAAKNAVTSGTALLIKNEEQWEALYSNGAASVGEWAAKFPGVLGNSLKVSVCDSSGFSGWEYRTEFDAAPGTSDYLVTLGNEDADDEMHIVVVDKDGLWTGTPNTVLEKFAFVSKASDAKKADGSNAFYRDVLRGSRYVHWMDHPASSNWGSTSNSTIEFDSIGTEDFSLSGGVSDDAPSDGALQIGWDLFANAEIVDVNLLFNGPNSLSVGQYLIQIAQARMDCIGFVSPNLTSVLNNAGDEAGDIISDRQATLNVNTSYGVMDSGWKYQYDKYNDLYRWIPLNADIAGLCARTDTIADPWYSPGGLNRGQIKNVVKLAYSPDKTDRDELYKNGINPVVSFPGEGTVLFGDKTLLAKPSAFDRINVRRLFIVLEKAIATAGKYQLFEFNDAFTRAQFRNLVEPFLRDVRGRRGIFDFRVVCDETNNTGEVIDRNEFVADIFIKPARSINFMQLNFIATRTGVSFEEVVGA
jgi:phage tail sheath protein FI